MIPNSGYIRVTISPTQATFEYVRSYLPGDGDNGVVADSVTIFPEASTDHTVTFNANGGSGTMSPQTASVPTALTLNTFTRTGYSFTGWNTAADGSGTPYADGATYGFSTDITLYAQWVGILGDVNHDGAVNSTDALIVLSCDVGIDTSGFCPMNCGDANNDGLCNSTDALIILSYDVGMTVAFPVGEPGCPSSVTPCPGCSP